MRLRHLAIPAAVGLAALTGLATPATAAPADTVAFLGLTVPQQVTVIEGHTKSVTATISNVGDGTAKGVVLKFTKVDPSVGLALPAGCDTATGCAVGELKPGTTRKLTFKLSPSAPTGADLTSFLGLEVTGAEGVVGNSTTVAVVRAKGGVDLEVADIDDMKLNRGQTANVPITVRNAGSATVDAISVVLIGEDGIETLSKYRNCEADIEDGMHAVACLFEGSFPAGAEFTVPAATPLQVKLAPDAGGPYTYNAAVVAVGVNKALAASLADKSGPKLTLKAAGEGDSGDYTDAPEDLNVDDNTAVFGIPVAASVADSAAVGGTFQGAVGDSATVKVGVRNLGPTAVVPATLQWQQWILVEVPTGLTVTKVDPACQLWLPRDPSSPNNMRDYLCMVPNRLGAKQSALFSFTGTILDGKHTPGYVDVDGGTQDKNTANNRAAIDVKLTGGGQGGGEDGGSLPITGAPTGLIAAGGALLLIVGAVFLATARRS